MRGLDGRLEKEPASSSSAFKELSDEVSSHGYRSAYRRGSRTASGFGNHVSTRHASHGHEELDRLSYGLCANDVQERRSDEEARHAEADAEAHVTRRIRTSRTKPPGSPGGFAAIRGKK
jgi:hypothetical protein